MVTKKNTFWETITYYNIPLILILAIGLSIGGFFLNAYIEANYSTSYFIKAFGIDTVKTTVYIGAFILWTYISFTTIRDARYYLLTDGRSYSSDKGKFKKDYFTLTNFFMTNDKYKMNLNELPNMSWKEADGIILCKLGEKLVYRGSRADGNAVCFGLPGSGKSTSQAAPSAISFNRKKGGVGVFAISIKGDLLNFVKGKRKHIKVFTPDKEEGSCHYNPLEGLEKMSLTERRVFVENLSIIICPDEPGENAAYFVGTARDWFCGTALLLMHYLDTGKISCLTFPHIVDFILHRDYVTIGQMIEESGCDIAGEYTNAYRDTVGKNVAGGYQHLVKKLRPFNNGALKTLLDGQGDCISPNDLLHGDVYIDVPQDKYQVYAPVMAIIVTNFLYAFMRRPDVSANKKVTPVLFLLDEVVQLNLDYSILSTAMSTLRSKKVSLFLLMQSPAQLEGRYGDAHAREIIDLCAYISVFNAQDPKSRRFFQELVGRRKMLQKSSSESQSTGNRGSQGSNVSEIMEYIFEAADFGNLGATDPTNKNKRVLVCADGKYILGEATPCYE